MANPTNIEELNVTRGARLRFLYGAFAFALLLIAFALIIVLYMNEIY